ncbi:MAG: STAS domain-containing protein [Spirochaetales bacterium]|nr:STAS domain-containing protein [Spirochaetales bacterium]
MTRSKLEPKLLTVLKEGISGKTLLHDLSAGVIVGIVALPLAIAFAIASGAKPEQGLYTAIVAGFLISLLSGSRVQIGGPTGAFVVIIYGVIQKYGYSGLVTATILAGIMLILMGVFRLGVIIKYIPYPVTVGFTTGIAVLIAVSQFKDFFGLELTNLPAEFLGKLEIYAQGFGSINFWAAGIGLFTVLLLILLPKLWPKFPASLLAVVITTLAVKLFNLPVQTIKTLFGSVQASFGSLSFPSIDFLKIPELLPSAVAIAFLAGIESLLSAVVADGMTGRRHRSNMELVAQGVANIASVCFGGIPATGAIARTATNIKNGGTTPFAGIFHAVTLLLIMLFLGEYVSFIPMATLAGILMVVSYRMSEIHLFVKLLKSPKSDILVLLVTFVLTLLLDLAVAIQVGIVLAALLFMRRMSSVTNAEYVTSKAVEIEDVEEEVDAESIRGLTVPPDVEIFEINGPFFFGAADKFRSQISLIEKKPKILILRLRKVSAVDATALYALEDIIDRSKRDHMTIILSGLQPAPKKVLENYGLAKKLGNENITNGINSAIARAESLLGGKNKDKELRR